MSRTRLIALAGTCAGLLALTAVVGLLAFPLAGTAWAGEPLEIKGDIQRPQALDVPAPVYPEEARKDRLEGKVIIKTIIDLQGKVQKPEVLGSSGHAILDKVALDAISAWTFKPATLHGKPVEVYYWLTIDFKADEK